MKCFKNNKQLQIFIFVLIAVLTLGVGYAAISAITLIINGTASVTENEANFKVHFDRNVQPTITANKGSATIDANDDKVAHIEVTGLAKKGDTATAEYTVINESNSIGAEITFFLTTTNTEYFRVTQTVQDNKLKAGESTKVRITVEIVKTPISDSVRTDITGALTVSPIENERAIGGNSVSTSSPVSFATDSWATIKTAVRNNNTDVYHVGDTKEVTINGTDYTVRIANKTTGANCSNEAYSETACGFVVEFVDVITEMKMRDTQTNTEGYPETKVYAYLKDTLYGQLPADLQNVIATTRVISGHGCNGNYDFDTQICDNPDNGGNNFVTNDKLYLLSGVEVFGEDEHDTAAATTSQLEYYQAQPTSDKVKQYNGSDWYWWLRSANSNNHGTFRTVTYIRLHSGSADEPYGVAPAFRIA